MTSQQQERIAQFRKMATDDPENELGHFSLGKALMDAGEFAEARTAFERTVALNREFSKAYQLLGACLIKLGQTDEAVRVLREGYAVADRRGDNMPRDEMAALLKQLGQEPPASTRDAAGPAGAAGFRCQRPGCRAGAYARQLPGPPMNDALGRQVYERICADCWREWLEMGIKVINELRLDFSDQNPNPMYQGMTASQVYDHYMKDFLGLDDPGRSS
jgi:tetratricopeptide (TPR) repeat protein